MFGGPKPRMAPPRMAPAMKPFIPLRAWAGVGCASIAADDSRQPTTRLLLHKPHNGPRDFAASRDRLSIMSAPLRTDSGNAVCNDAPLGLVYPKHVRATRR